MNRNDIIEKARKVVSELLDIEPDTVKEESEFADLGADSLDSVEITMALEEEFDIEITDDEAIDAHTFKQLVDVIAGKVA